MIERLTRPASARPRARVSPPARSAWVAPAFGASARAVSRGDTPQERYDKLQAHLSRPRQKGEHVEQFRNRIAAASALHEAHAQHHSGGFLNYVGGQAKQFASNFDPRPYANLAVTRAHELRHPLRYAPELALAAEQGANSQALMAQGVVHQLGAMTRDPLYHLGDAAALAVPIGPHGAELSMRGATHLAANARQLDLASELGQLGPLRAEDPVVKRLNSMLGPGKGKRLQLPNLPYTNAHGPLDRNGVPLMAYNYPPPVEQFYQPGYLADFLRGIPQNEVETRLDMLQQELNKEHWNLRAQLGHQFPTNLSVKRRHHPYIFEPRVEDLVRRGLKKQRPRAG